MTRDQIKQQMSIKEAIQVLIDTKCYGTMDIAKSVIIEYVKEQGRFIPIDKAKDAMRGLYEDDVNLYGADIPECFDYKRANEALEMLIHKFNVEVYYD